MGRSLDHQVGERVGELAGRVLAIDVGGTRTKLALVDPDGDVDGLVVEATPPTADAMIQLVRRIGRALLAGEPPRGVGVCVPGLVGADGRVSALPGKLDGIVGRDLVAELSAAFDAPSLVVNDAIAYGAGEATRGAGVGFGRVVVMTVGTGVGVAVLEAGHPVTRGALGGGLQGGQIPLPGGDPRFLDTSDHYDTLEALCRARRIVDYTLDAGGTDQTVEEVFAAYAAGAAAAQAGVERWRAAMVLAVRALANAHGADAVVVGGGPLTEGGPLLAGVEAAVQAQLWPTHTLAVRRAALGDAAALLGLAELLARH